MEDGTVTVKNAFYPQGYFVNKYIILTELLENLWIYLHGRFERKEGKGSEWSILKILSLEIKLNKTGVTATKWLSEYTSRPNKCPGPHHIVNNEGKHGNYVLTSLIAHFNLKETNNLTQYKIESCNTYLPFKYKYFSFPRQLLNRPIALDDFPLIKKGILFEYKAVSC